MAQTVKQPVFELWMEDVVDLGNGETLNIAPLVLSCTYSDRAHGESDELRIDIDDFDARYFKGAWMPRKGQGISLTIGYAGEPLAPRGRFEIDEIEFNGPPDVLTVRALAAAIKKPLRTDDHREYEEQTLLEVARTIAERQGYGLRGDGTGPMADIEIERITQNGEADLAFLKRLAEPYGYVFKIDPPDLVFDAVADQEAAAAALTLDRKELSSFRITSSTAGTYKACEVRYHDPKTGRLITGKAGDDAAVKEDTLKVTVRCESEAQARTMARERLRRANAAGEKGGLTLPGRPELTAGCVVELTGLLNLSGRYLVERSEHRFSRSAGYVMDVEIRRV